MDLQIRFWGNRRIVIVNEFGASSLHTFRCVHTMPKQPTVSVQPVSKCAGGGEVHINGANSVHGILDGLGV